MVFRYYYKQINTTFKHKNAYSLCTIQIKNHNNPHARTHRADETPQNRPFGGHGHQHLNDGPAAGYLHPLTVLREAVNLHNKQPLQQRSIHLWNLKLGTGGVTHHVWSQIPP